MADVVKNGKVIRLEFPIEWGSEGAISEVTVQRPKAKHMRGINTDTIEGQLKLVSLLIEKPPAFVDEIDMKDMRVIDQVVKDFLGISEDGN